MKNFHLKQLWSRALLLALVLLLPAYASAGNAFERYNITGTSHTLVQQDHDIFWEGGFVNILKDGRVHFEHPGAGYFVSYKIHYMKWEPRNSNGHTIIYNNGLQSHAGWFYETAEKLSAKGYTVFAFDRIGSGRSSDGMSVIPSNQTPEAVAKLNRGPGHVGNWKAFTHSIHLMKQLAKSQHPENAVHIWANSFAANIVTAYLLQYEPTDVSSFVFTSPGLFSKLPLPFSIPNLINAQPGTYFPTTIPEQNADQGAYLFTSMSGYAQAIAEDRDSLRKFTKEFYFSVPDIQNYHSRKSAAPNSFLTQTRRFYLVVDGDPMMDTTRTMNYVFQYSTNAAVKRYSGGPDHRHFLEFTEDAEAALQDVDAFIQGREVIGNEIQ